jgi:hypothetical protein
MFKIDSCLVYTKISYIKALSKVWFIQDFSLFKAWLRQVSLYNNIFVMSLLFNLMYIQTFLFVAGDFLEVYTLSVSVS